MDVPQKILNYWGDMLVKIPSHTLDQWKLPANTPTFLETVGLPVDERLDTYLNLNLKFHPDNLSSLTYEQQLYITVGSVKFYDTYGYICLNETNGECVQIDNRSSVGNPFQFINSNIQSFLIFIKLCLDNKPQIRELAYKKDDIYQQKTSLLTEEGRHLYRSYQKAMDEIIVKMQWQFTLLDKKALSNTRGYHYWSRYIADFY